MATAYHNLSDYDFSSVPSAEKMKFGIVVSEWNYNITGALLKGAIDTLKKHGANISCLSSLVSLSAGSGLAHIVRLSI